MEVPERWSTEVREDAIWFRFLLWLYPDEILDKRNADFCRLFWATIAVPLAVFVKFLLLILFIVIFIPSFIIDKVIAPIVDKLVDFFRWIRKKKKTKPSPTRQEIYERERLKENLIQEARKKKLQRKEKWDNFFGSVGAKASSVSMWVEDNQRWLKPLALGFAITIAFGLGFLLILVFIAVAPDIWVAIQWAGNGIANVIYWVVHWSDWLKLFLGIGIILTGLAIALFLAYFFNDSPKGQLLRKRVRLGWDTHFSSFFKAMGTAIKAIKYRTCPEIKVVSKTKD